MQRATALIYDKGVPTLCELAIRESTTAPDRLKVAFVADLPEDGEVVATGEAAEAMGEVSALPAEAAGHTMLGPEFRLEMN